MHVGPEKGKVLDDAMKECVKINYTACKNCKDICHKRTRKIHKFKKMWVSCIDDKKTFNVLELGTYCGYSTLRIVNNLPKNGQIYSIDPNNGPNTVASQLVKFAKVENKITFLKGYSQNVIPNLNKCTSRFDLIFIEKLSKKLSLLPFS